MGERAVVLVVVELYDANFIVAPAGRICDFSFVF